MKKLIFLFACGLLTLANSAQADVVLEYNFDTDINPWTPNGQVVGFTQATASTGEGVMQFTSGAANNDPQVNLDLILAPGAGETWDTITIRQRQFAAPDPNTDPQTFTTPQPYNVGGTIFLNRTPFVNYTGNQSASDSDANGWTIVTWDISSRGAVEFNNMRFDFVGGGNRGVEVDWVRFNDSGAAVVPEPTSLGLLGLAGIGMLVRRKKRVA